jgi:hypothetical protein
MASVKRRVKRPARSQAGAIACALGVVVAASCASIPSAPAADLKISFGELTRLLQSIAGGAKIYLNNVPGGMFANQSFVQITSAQQYPLSVPVKSFDILGSKYGYFVSDVSSTSVRVTTVPGALRLTVGFESEGPEAVATCISGACQLTNVLPDIQWDNATVNIDFVPIRFGGSLSLEVKSVSTGGTPKAVCKDSDFLSRQSCNLGLPFANRSIQQLKAELPAMLKSAVNQQAIQQQLADGLKRYLTLGQAGEVAISAVSVDPKTLTVNFSFNAAGGP